MASLFRSEEQAIQEIIKLIPNNSEDISIFDILKAYDTYIEESGISFEDPFAYDVYEIIIHASRRAQDNQLRSLLTNYNEIQKLKMKQNRKNSGYSDNSDNSEKPYAKKNLVKQKISSKFSSKNQSLSPKQGSNFGINNQKNDRKEYNIQFKNFDTSSGEENDNNFEKQEINEIQEIEYFPSSQCEQQQMRGRLGQYQQFASKISNSGLKMSNPFNDNLYRYATEQADQPNRYSIRKYSYSPNNKMDSHNNLNRSISPVYHYNNRSLSPHLNNSKLSNYQARLNTSNSNNNSLNSSVNQQQSQRVRFNTQNADEYVNIQSPLNSINNFQANKQIKSNKEQVQQRRGIQENQHQTLNRSIDNSDLNQKMNNIDNKKYLSLESKDYQQYQFNPAVHKKYLSLDSSAQKMHKQQENQDSQNPNQENIQFHFEKRHRSVDEIEEDIDLVRNEMALGLRRKWVLHYHFANWKDYIQRWKGATEYINKEEQVENFIKLKIQRKFFEKWVIKQVKNKKFLLKYSIQNIQEQYVQEENTWKEAKLNFVMNKRQNILRKCFNELRDRLNDGKIDKYTYYAAKYKKEQALKEKYFQKFIQFSRNHRSNRLKLERTQQTAQNNLKKVAFNHLKQLKTEKKQRQLIKDDIKMKQSLLEKKISFDRFVNSIRSILCFKKKKEILNKAIEIQLKQHSLLSMIDNFRIIKYFKIQDQRANEFYNKNLSSKFFYHLKLFLFNNRERVENTDSYNQLRIINKHQKQWQKFVQLNKSKEQKYKDGRILYFLYRMMIMILNDNDYQISQQRNIQFEAFKEQVLYLQKMNQLFNNQQYKENQQSFGKGESEDEQIDPTHQSMMQNSSSNNNLMSNHKKLQPNQKSKNYLFSRSTQATAMGNNVNPNQVFDTVRSFSPAPPRQHDNKTSRTENLHQEQQFLSENDQSDNQRLQRNLSEQNFIYLTQRQSQNNILKIYENQEIMNEQQIDEEIALQIIGHGIFFTYPSILSINYYNKTQTEKLFQSHRNLNQFILSKSFKSWVTFLRSRNDFRKKMLNKTYQKHFDAMKIFSTKSQCLRFCVEKMQKKLNKKTVENVFREMSLRAQERKNSRNSLKIIKEKIEKKLLKKYFKIYRREFSSSRGYSENYEQAGIYYKKWLIVQSFQAIQNYANRQRMVRDVISTKFQTKNQNEMNRIFYSWRIYSDKRRQRNFIYQQIRQIYERKVYKECLFALANYRDKHSKSTENKNIVKSYLFNKYIVKSFQKILNYSKSHKIKSILTEKIRIAYKQKLMQNYLHKLKDYKNYRQKKVSLQAKNTEKVEKVFQKKHFRAWYKLGCRNQSFRYLVDLVKRLQLSRFFVIMKYLRQRDFQKQKIIKSDHLIFLKLTIFNAFVKYYRKRKYERKSLEYIKCRQQINYAKQSMKQWKKLHSYNKNVTYLCAKSIITIKNDILMKYFGKLKQKWFLKSQESRLIKENQIKLKRKILLGLRKYTTNKMINYENMIAINEKRKKQIKQNILNIWLRKLFNKQRQEDVSRAIIKYRKHKVLQIWADLFNIKNNLQNPIKVSDFQGFKRLEETQEIHIITTNRGKKRNLRQFFFNMLKVSQKLLKQKGLIGLKNAILKRKIENKKLDQIQNKFEADLLSKYLLQWQRSSQRKINKYNMIVKLRNVFQKYQKRIGFEAIQGQEQIYLDLIQKSKKAVTQRQKSMKMKSFSKLKAYYLKKKKIARRKLELEELVQRNNTLNFFKKLKFYSYKKQENKQKNVYIQDYLYLNLLKKVFNKIRTYQITKQILAQKSLKLQSYLNKKKLKRGFKQIKQNFSETKSDMQNTIQSLKAYRMNLQLKSFAVLRKYMNIQKLKSEKYNNAYNKYYFSLATRIFGALKGYILNKNIEKDNHLYILDQYRQRKQVEIKKGILMVWKYYTNQSINQVQQFRSCIESSILKSKFIEWKIKTHLLRDKRMKYNIIQNSNNFRLRARLFKIWKQRAKLNSVLTNIFVYHARIEIKKRLLKWNQSKNLLKKLINKSQQQVISKPRSAEDIQKMRQVFQMIKEMAQNTQTIKNNQNLRQKQINDQNVFKQFTLQFKASQLVNKLNQLRYFSSAQQFIFNLKQMYIQKKQDKALAKKSERLNSPKFQKNQIKNSMVQQTLKEQKLKDLFQKLNKLMIRKQKQLVSTCFSNLREFADYQFNIQIQANQYHDRQLQFKTIKSWKNFVDSCNQFSQVIEKVLSKALKRCQQLKLRDAFRQIQVRYIKLQAANIVSSCIDRSVKRQYAQKLFELYEQFKSKTQVLKHLIENHQIKMNTQRAIQFFNILKNLKMQSEHSKMKCKEYLFIRRIKQMKSVLTILQIYTQYRRNKNDRYQKAHLYWQNKSKQKYLYFWARAYQNAQHFDEYQQDEFDQQEFYEQQQKLVENELMQQLALHHQQQLNQQGNIQQLTKQEQEEQLHYLQQQYEILKQQQQKMLQQQQQNYQQQQNQRYLSNQSDQFQSDENEYYNEEPVTYSDANYLNIPLNYNPNSNYDQNIQQKINQNQQENKYDLQEQDMADLLFDKPRQYIPSQQRPQIQSYENMQKQSNIIQQEHLIIKEQSEEHESGNDSQLQKYLRESQSYNQDNQNDSYQNNQENKSKQRESNIESYQVQSQNESYEQIHSYQHQDEDIHQDDHEIVQVKQENFNYSQDQDQQEEEEEQQYTFSQDGQKSSSNTSKNMLQNNYEQQQQNLNNQQQNIIQQQQLMQYQQQQLQQQLLQNQQPKQVNMSFENIDQNQADKSQVEDYKEDDFYNQGEFQDQSEEDSQEQTNFMLQQYLLQKQETLVQMVFNVWRKFAIEKKIKRNQEEEAMETAYQVYENNLSRRVFLEWKEVCQERINMSKQQMRSYLYACFSSWKMFSKEKKLLKKYLSEAQLDEQLAYTPQTTDRLNLLFNNNDPRSSQQKFQRSGSYNNLEASNKTSSDSQKSASLASALFTGKLKIQDTSNLDKNAPH
ncbi:hypothetical protein ABPG74_021510 [Tetrahymena malaccensis]